MKNKILIIMCIILLLQTSVSATTYFPPHAAWTTGYNSGADFSKNDDRMRLYLNGEGEEGYFVTDAQKDLFGIAYLKVDWRSTTTLAFPSLIGNGSLMISDNKNDANYDVKRSKLISFSRTNSTLDTTGYSGSKYIKFGGNITHNKFPAVTPSVYIYAYDITGFNYSNSTTLNATNVEETSATLNANISCDPNDNITCGFWVGINSTVNGTDYVKNVTCSSLYSRWETASTGVSGLTPAEYYYVRSWTKQSPYSYNLSSTVDQFFTKPNPPSNFRVTNRTATTLELVWTNSTIGTNTNQSVIIKYDTTSYPTTIDSGTLLCNESKHDNYTATGLSEDTTYYFSAWTYANDTGSPMYAKISDTYASATDTTVGGVYQITVRFENESTSGNNRVDLSQYGKHKFVIHYEDETDLVIFNNSWEITTSGVIGYFGDINKGNFTLELDKTIYWIELFWNSTNGSDYTCHRTIVPLSEQRNITFYIRTDALVYGESTAFWNGSLVNYVYYFKDDTGYYSWSSGYEPYADIYTYNSTGRLTIDRQYLLGNDEVHAMLLYDKTYFIGVGSTEYDIDRLGQLPTGQDTEPEPINIPASLVVNYSFFDVIKLDIGWKATPLGFYIYYQDTMYGTNSVSIYVYWNGSEVFNETSNNDYHNFTYNFADKNKTYNVTLEVNHTTWDTNVSISFKMYGNLVGSITDIDSLNDLISKFLGNTPFRNLNPSSENYEATVSWTYILVAVIAGILMLSVGYFNAYLGMIATGGWLATSTFLIEGIDGSFILIGIFLIAMAIIFAYAMGGKQ